MTVRVRPRAPIKIQMEEFLYKWVTLSKAVFNNTLRNLAILKYIFTKKNNSQDHTSYYKNLDILKDKWFESLPEDEIEQGNFIESEGSKT